LINVLINDYASKIDDTGQKMLALVDASSKKLKSLVDGLLEYSRSDNLLKEQKTKIELDSLINDISGLFSFDTKINIILKSSLKEIYTNRTAIEQILINLVANAIKYNDKDIVEIEIGVSEYKTNYEFYVQDNGWGIAPDQLEKIFKIFEIVAAKDKFGQTGNGIGLATVKKIVEASGGSIRVESAINDGSKFIFTLDKGE
jgi:signal transduction histidine kinase